MLVPKVLIGKLVHKAGTKTDWWVCAQCWYYKLRFVGACCWYLKLSLVGWYLLMVPKTFVGGLVPDAGT